MHYTKSDSRRKSHPSISLQAKFVKLASKTDTRSGNFAAVIYRRTWDWGVGWKFSSKYGQILDAPGPWEVLGAAPQRGANCETNCTGLSAQKSTDTGCSSSNHPEEVKSVGEVE
jgi:hypothetical protein